MMNNKKKARFINECIENIRSGVITRVQCLLEYPDLAEEIQSTLSLIDNISGITFSAEAEIDPRLQKINLLQKLPDREGFVTKHIDHRYRLQNLKRRFAMTWVIIFSTIISLISGAGAIYASSEALPGDTLYPVKIWTENVQLAIAPDDVDMGLYLQFANMRIEEAAKLIQEGRPEDLDEAVAGYQQRTEILTQSMLRIQAEDPEEAVKLRLDLEQKLQEQARRMQSYIIDEGENEVIGDHLREQIRLMLETNTQLRLRINDGEDVLVDETEGLVDDVVTSIEVPDLEINEDGNAKNEGKVPSIQENDETGTLIFGLGGRGGNGVYMEINGMRYDCVVESYTASCGTSGAPQKGNVNLYDQQTNQLLYSSSYEFEHAFDYEWEGEKNDSGNNDEHIKDGESGKVTNMETNKNGKEN